jgi:GxxExxY protein
MMPLVADPVAEKVIGCAIAVHRAIGPGLFESVYEKCVGLEFEANDIRYACQVPLVLTYRGHSLPSVYRVDFIVDERLLVELKTVERFLPIHRSQMLTYLKLSGLRQGLLINFNSPKLVDGLKSFLR